MHNKATLNISSHNISPDMINGKTMGVSNSGWFINERVEVVIRVCLFPGFSTSRQTEIPGKIIREIPGTGTKGESKLWANTNSNGSLRLRNVFYIIKIVDYLLAVDVVAVYYTIISPDVA